MSGTTGSFTTVQNVNYGPQAKADTAVSYENEFILIDVLANDLGGNAKVLWSLNQVDQAIRTTDGSKVTLASGARVWFVDGQLAYDGRGASGFDYLAVGERATDTFTYAIRMSTGVVSYATVTVTVLGTNDAPTIVLGGDWAGGVTEDSTPVALVDSGSFGFQDLDLSNSHTVSVGAARIATSAGVPAGFVPAAGIGVLGAVVVENTTDAINTGSIDWTFTAANAAVQGLAAGETVTQVYALTITDTSGASVTQDVTVTLTGTNDGPTIGGGDFAGGMTEDQAAILAEAGSFTFEDLDLSNTHTVSVAAAQVSTSSAVPAGFVPAAGFGTLNASVVETVTDLDNKGRIDWTYSVDNGAVQGLAAGETVTQVYTLAITDSSGASATQNVTITLTGTNDGPTIVGGDVAGAVTENHAAILADGGSFTFEDLDLSNTHGVAVGAAQVSTSSAVPAGFVPGAGFGTLNASVVETVTDLDNKGRIDWTYSVDDAVVQGLAAGEAVTQVYTLTITDSSGASVTQDVTITLTGTNDGPTIVGGDVAGAMTEDQSAILGEAGSFTFEDLDLSNSHGVTVGAAQVSTSSAVPAGFVPAAGCGTLNASVIETVTDLDNKGRIDWTYAVDNAAVQGLAAGETVTQVYTLTIKDSSGAAVTQDVTITLTGTNDGPTIVGGDTDGALVEDSAATLAEAGSIAFRDLDLSNTHLVDVSAPAISTAGRVLPGIVPAGGFGRLTAAIVENAGDLDDTGRIDWSFSVDDSAVQGLAAGETVTQVYTLTLTDSSGATVSQDVSITLTGTNDAAVLGAAAGGEVLEADGTRSLETFASASAAGWTRSGGAAPVEPPHGTFSHFLGRFGSSGGAEQVSKTFALDAAADKAVISFDFLKIDSWDGENLNVFLNGQKAFDFKPGAFTALPGVSSGTIALAGGITGTYNVTWSGDDTQAGFGGSNWGERSYRVTIELNDAGSAVKLGFGSTLNQAIADESYGIDNVRVSHPLTDAGTISFTDVDLSDAHVVSASFASSTGGAQLGSFAASVSTDSTGGGAGTVSWTYSVDHSKVQHLAAGETIVETYTVTLADGEAGGTVTRDVQVVIRGENDAPTILLRPLTSVTGSVTELADLAAGENSIVHVRTGSVSFADADLSDVHSASAAAQGAGYLGSLTLDSVDQSANSVAWTFSVGDSAIDFLAAGEQRVQHYTITIADGKGGTVDQTVTVTITGTNDALTITSGAQSGAVTEKAEPGEGGLLSAAGAVSFADVDLIDTHTASVAPAAGGYLGSLTLGAVDQAGNSVAWTYSVADGALDFLAAGETRTQSYRITIADGRGGTAQQIVTITLTGTNDAPVITSAAQSGAVAEKAERGEGGTLSAAGAVSFADVDVIDTHSASVAPKRLRLSRSARARRRRPGGQLGRLDLFGRGRSARFPRGGPDAHPELHDHRR
jgi:VCBS repeat-containing protein